MVSFWAKTLATLLLTVVALAGLPRLDVTSDLMRALDAEAPAVQAYAAFTTRFDRPRDEVLLVQSADFANPSLLSQLEELVFELQFLDGVAAVGSILSVPAMDGSAPAIGASDAPLSQTLTDMRATSPLARVLMSADHTATVVTLTPDGTIATQDLVATIAGSGAYSPDLTVLPIGLTAMERSVEKGLLFDQQILTPLAGLVSLIATWVLFWSWRAALVCTVPALLGLIWYVGALGWLRVPIDPFIGLVPTVILVLGLADAVHVYFSVSDARRGGASPDASVTMGLRRVFVAVALTSGTTAMAFFSLGILGSSVLDTLAWVGMLGMTLAFGALWLSVPVIYRVVRPDTGRAPPRFNWFEKTADWLRGRPKRVMIVTLVLFAVALAGKLQTDAGFTFDENVPRKGPVRDGFERMAEAGLAQDALFVVAPEGNAAIPQILYNANLGPDSGISGTGAPRAYPLPIALGAGNGADVIAKSAEVTAQLAQAGVSDVQVQAFSLLISSEVPRVIGDLRLSFYLSVAIVAGLIAWALRSTRLALISLIPNLLPIFLVEALLFTQGIPLTVAGAVAMILAFGIAVDDSAHLLNAYGQARDQGHEDPVGRALERKVRPMTLTAILLLAGFALSSFSAMPSISNFGLLIACSLTMALATNIFLLPSLLHLWDKRA